MNNFKKNDLFTYYHPDYPNTKNDKIMIVAKVVGDKLEKVDNEGELVVRQYPIKYCTKIELKPCPLCGSHEIAIHVPNKNNKEDIMCLHCGLKLEKACGVGVVKCWNNRK